MVDPVDKKITALIKERESCKDPVERETFDIQIDNLLDIRLSRMSRKKETANGN